jgi:PAS domain-containing protein
VAVGPAPGSEAPQPEALSDGRIRLDVHGRCAELRLVGEPDLASAGALEGSSRDWTSRVFVKVPRPTLRERLTFATRPLHHDAPARAESLVRDQAFDAAPIAQIVLDEDGTVVAINQQARALFGLAAADLGRPLKDLELSYRPVELWSNLEVAFSERRAITLSRVTTTLPSGDVLTGREPRAETVLDATNRRGRHVRLQVTCLPLAVDGAKRIEGAIVLMDVLDEAAGRAA